MTLAGSLLTAYFTYTLFSIAVMSVTRSGRMFESLTVLHGLMVLAMPLVLMHYGGLPVYYPGGFVIDALAAYELLIAGIVFSLTALYSGGHITGLIEAGLLESRNRRLFYEALNVTFLAVVIAFSTGNLAVYWIATELTTFLAAFLIAILKSRKNIDASLSYLLVTSTAMLFTFIGVILIYAVAEEALGVGTLEWGALTSAAKSLPVPPLAAAFAFLFIGLAAKAGAAPFHTPLPHAYTKAPSMVSAILSAIMPNVGLYGIIRICRIANGTGAWDMAATLLAVFGVFSLAVAGLSMLRQKNIKKLLAFSSVENAGLMFIGLSIGTPAAVFWVLLHKLAHSLTKTLLFLSAGILTKEYSSNKAAKITGALRRQPLASMGVVLGGVALVGMPPFMMFPTELGILSQVAGNSIYLLLIVLSTLLCAGAGIAMLLSEAFTGTDTGAKRRYTAPARMTAPIILLVVLLLILGLYMPAGLDSILHEISYIQGFPR